MAPPANGSPRPEDDPEAEPEPEAEAEEQEEDLPQCKIKRNYACPQCTYFTQNPRFFLYHLKNVHKQKLRIYECPHCLYASKHSQKLQRHLQMVHVMGAGKKRESPRTSAPAPRRAEEEDEEEREEEEAEEEEEEEEVKEVVNGEEVFKCGACSFTSRSRTLVARHEKVVHLKKKFFRCVKCNYVTHMKARFTKHVKYHSMPMIKCDLCDFKTPYKWNLDRHMKNHAGDGAFKCSLCTFTADIKQSLTVHEMNHHVPPVGHQAPARRRNRVGASDSLQLLQEQNTQMHALSELSLLNEIEITKKPENPSTLKKSMMKRPKPVAQFNAKELTVKIGAKVVNPGDVIQHKNGTVYVKKLKCRACDYRAAWESEMSRHEQRVHGLDEKKSPGKPGGRPIPNLIPIQNKPTGPPAPLPPPPLPMPPRHMMAPGKPSMPTPQQLAQQQQYQQSINQQAFLQQHVQNQYRQQTHNLPLQFTPHLPSRFAQPKNMTPKVRNSYPMAVQRPLLRPSPPPPPILKIPTPTKVRNTSTPPLNSSPDKAMSEKDLNDICAKSCPTSALKDFASVIGGEEAFRPEGEAPDQEQTAKLAKGQENSSDSHVEDGQKSPEATKKKNSFFDELKEKFGAGESCNLVCNVCGHESKCLSESLRHQKIHNVQISASSSGSSAVFSNADLSSTRCQYCRHRCKTSSDLMVHLKSCPEANKGSSDVSPNDNEEEFKVDGDEDQLKNFQEGEEPKSEEGVEGPHPMENKVFVWTNTTNGEEDGMDDEYECGSQSPNSDCVFGVETAPGIGAVTSKTNNNATTPTKPEAKPKPDNSVKKVYKCPHCSFWASTASRFHVHIVGHLNKKPFECSLCSYRSNWRWDITKHIRLKTVRDSTHQRAKVLMTDETGRRNYSKYNKYLTLMRVHEPSGESSGAGQRGKKLTQSFEPIESLPAPPPLTPAPPSPQSSPQSYRRPPPLQPGADSKRKAQTDEPEEPPKKRGMMENKKTMWKCKKCLFRDSDRAVVLAHVKEHYRSQNQTGAGGSAGDTSDEASQLKAKAPPVPVPAIRPDEPYMCGHCHQRSQWKHVIQRHCRLKHNGDIKVGLAPRQSIEDSDKTDDENVPESYLCETCPFSTNSQQALEDHVEKHFDRSGANLKCYHCPFYVSDREELLQHISLHGEQEGEEKGDGYYEGEGADEGQTPADGEQPVHHESGETVSSKRYRCTACPYVSNSKTQFLYHKQFHRPRGAPFQCTLCSYNVPRRHFLQQHMKLHGVSLPLPRRRAGEPQDQLTPPPPNGQEIDTSGLPEIPLVWVSKLGSLTKMFKCRFCPHVNIRKSNIQEHEKMHSDRTRGGSGGGGGDGVHHCPECNYVCNNAGVLSSHAKVHQGLFGQVVALVDPARLDEDQIKDLNALMGREEEGPPEISPDEINKDFRDSSHQLTSTDKQNYDSEDDKVLHFCSICPARFLYPKELEIHLRFHSLQLQFQCDSCSYTARQQPHLMAHYKVHTDEYQDRTTALCEVYRISEDHPKPKIAVIVDGSEEVGPAWVVVERQKTVTKDPQNEYDLDEAPSDASQHGGRIVTKQFACDQCPATFFKSVALQYHTTLHGGPGIHKCRVCDYAVKTYGNLIKHEAVHEELEPRMKLKTKLKKTPDNIPMSGTELFKQKTEANQKVAAMPVAPPPLHIDPEFGILMHGSPEFVYPTYLKNGRLKEKRYKCHKCPSAFEKREQYKVHLSLHGSKQRYSCERCDYSVKYYANYIQHLRKHQHNDATKAERKSSTDKSTDDSPNDEGSESMMDVSVSEEFQPQTPVSCRSAKRMQMSMADQQTTMLMQQRVITSSAAAPEVLNRCPYCPYSNVRKEGVGSHVKCHSNARGGAFACRYCDYTVPQQHFLRDHNKLHFAPSKGCRPEAYMKCDRLELWAEPVVPNGEDKSEKVLIFKDRGVNTKEARFLPPYQPMQVEQPDEEKEKTFINLKTGEIDMSNDNSEKEDDNEPPDHNPASENSPKEEVLNKSLTNECDDGASDSVENDEQSADALMDVDDNPVNGEEETADIKEETPELENINDLEHRTEEGDMETENCDSTVIDEDDSNEPDENSNDGEKAIEHGQEQDQESEEDTENQETAAVQDESQNQSEEESENKSVAKKNSGSSESDTEDSSSDSSSSSDGDDSEDSSASSELPL